MAQRPAGEHPIRRSPWTRGAWPLAAACLSGLLACSGGGSSSTPPPPTPECDKAANVARRAEIVASQPVLGVRTRTIATRTVSFPSVADDPSVQCPVDLQFKDLNGNGTLEPYEDWRNGAAARAADLVGRMTSAQKIGLMAHPVAAGPAWVTSALSPSLSGFITAGSIRFGQTAANNGELMVRATWANNVQALAEAQPLGIPFVLSSEPAHSSGNGRVKARGFSQWPQELSLGAGASVGAIENFGKVVSQEYRAIGIRMALSPNADLATEPRWVNSQFTFGENGAEVADRVAAYVKGAQGTALGPTSVACVVRHFPGAGPAQGGWDARLAKGKYVTYPGNALDAHLAAFAKAFTAGVAGVMPGYGIPLSGSWSALSGLVDGSTIEQVGAAFNHTLVTDVLRANYGHAGLVLAPWGILDDAGVSPLGAPWGMETATPAQRAAKAVNAGVDQFAGLSDTTPISAALSAGGITAAQVDAAATRALTLMFRLGLFEDPYVDPTQAPALCNTGPALDAGRVAMDAGIVLLKNALKPLGWLNGSGDGTQTGDPGNAGNGTLRVLPAPPGQPYVTTGCNFYVAGTFDVGYVDSVSPGYGSGLTNSATTIRGCPATTVAEQMALSDYVFIRIDAPFTLDPDSGSLGYPLAPLEYAANANASQLDVVRAARAAIDGYAGCGAPSQAQIIVTVDAGRPSVVQEILDIGVSGLYVTWGTREVPQPDKALLDMAFGIFNGTGKLPVGLPLSDAAAAAQLEDLAGDGQDATFVAGFGIPTPTFF